MSSKSKKNYKKMRKAARKFYGDSFSFEPDTSIEDLFNYRFNQMYPKQMPAVPNAEDLIRMQELNGSLVTPKCMPSYGAGPIQMPLKGTSNVRERDEVHLTKRQEYESCKMNVSDVLSVLNISDQSFIHGPFIADDPLLDEGGLYKNNGCVPIVEKVGTEPNCNIGLLTSEAIRFRDIVDNKPVRSICESDGEVVVTKLNHDYTMKPEDIFSCACFHGYGYLAKDGKEGKEFIENLRSIYEIFDGHNNSLPGLSAYYDLLDHKIMFVTAAEYRIWMTTMSKMYGLMQERYENCSTMMTFQKIRRLSGAYYFPEDQYGFIKFDGVSRRGIITGDYFQSSTVFGTYLETNDPLADTGTAVSISGLQRTITIQDMFNIKPDDRIMIVHVADKYDYNDIDEMMTSEENINPDLSDYERSILLEKDSVLAEHINQQHGLSDDQKDALNANLKEFHQEQNS